MTNIFLRIDLVLLLLSGNMLPSRRNITLYILTKLLLAHSNNSKGSIKNIAGLFGIFFFPKPSKKSRSWNTFEISTFWSIILYFFYFSFLNMVKTKRDGQWWNFGHTQNWHQNVVILGKRSNIYIWTMINVGEIFIRIPHILQNFPLSHTEVSR